MALTPTQHAADLLRLAEVRGDMDRSEEAQTAALIAIGLLLGVLVEQTAPTVVADLGPVAARGPGPKSRRPA